MFSKWGKSKSSKEVKKKSNAESIITSLNKKITMPGTHWRQRGSSTSKTKSKPKSRKCSRSPSPSRKVACCHSYDESQPAQTLPHPSKSCHVDSVLSEPSLDRGPKISLERCPKISLERGQSLKIKSSAVIGEGDMHMSATSYTSDSYDPYDSLLVSPQASEYENGIAYEANSPVLQPKNYMARPRSPKLNASDSLMLSPSTSPRRVFGQCMNPGSAHNSGNNSFTEHKPCELFCPQSKWSPEGSPLTSPRMMSSGLKSRIQSGSVSPLHPRTGSDDGRKQSYPLPLPPIQISIPAPFSAPFSPVTSPRIPRSLSRIDNPPSPTSCWKKGRLLGRGTFGHVYLGFNSKSGEMCAMKEVTLFSDDAKSKESAQQLRKEISLLSRLRHPNIVQYFGSEMVDDKLYIYLEYVSGGSIHRILQEYGHLGEAAIRSYTQQILSGLAYLHATNTLHRDIKGANILVDPNGRVRLADFGMAKHITGNSCPLSFKGSPYWMAPEVITNSRGCNLAVDIWSLGCTVLEMATTKPPWSQYEGVAAMFKVGNSKELPEIPDHLSGEGKDFVLKCLQRNPSHRPTAVELLEHPFVRNASVLERPVSSAEPVESNSTKHVPRLSETHMVKNISCPVSPSRNSPQRTRGRLSLSPPTLNPQAISGALSPTAEGSKGKYHALKVLQKARSSVATFSTQNDCANQPLSSTEQLYDSHFVLAGRVSQHLLGSPVR